MGFAETLRQARLRAGYTQAELGRRLVTAKRPEGVWSTYVGQLEKGEKVPSEEVCLRLADVLGLDPLSLLLAALRAKADTEPASALFEALEVAVASCGGAGQALTAAATSDPTVGAAAELVRMDVWGPYLAALCQMGRLAELASLLTDLQGVSEQEWEALVALMQHTGTSGEGTRR